MLVFGATWDFDLFTEPRQNRGVNLIGPVGGADQKDRLAIA